MQHALKESVALHPVLSSSAALQDYLRLKLAGEQVEQLRGLFLNSRNELLKDVMLARGTISAVPLSPREIVRCGLDLGATALILLHNHPSGDPTPSKLDIEASQRVARAAALFDIHLHDHLIIGAASCTSLAAMGLLRRMA